MFCIGRRSILTCNASFETIFFEGSCVAWKSLKLYLRNLQVWISMKNESLKNIFISRLYYPAVVSKLNCVTCQVIHELNCFSFHGFLFFPSSVLR